jgi:hypothetical protein
MDVGAIAAGEGPKLLVPPCTGVRLERRGGAEIMSVLQSDRTTISLWL